MSANLNSNVPIRSTYADNADMVEMVQMYLGNLPKRVQALQQALDDTDIATLTTLAHQMKGSAAGYGFAPIGEAAGQLERLARDQADLQNLRQQFDLLAALCARAAA